MGTVIIRAVGGNTEVTYMGGKGKTREQIYQELLPGTDLDGLKDEIAARLADIRIQTRRQKYAPATK